MAAVVLVVALIAATLYSRSNWNTGDDLPLNAEASATYDPEAPTGCAGLDVAVFAGTDVASKLNEYGIWAVDPQTGDSVGIGAIVDQLWAKWYGSANAFRSVGDVKLDLYGGFMNADIIALFSSDSLIEQKVRDTILTKASDKYGDLCSPPDVAEHLQLV